MTDLIKTLKWATILGAMAVFGCGSGDNNIHVISGGATLETTGESVHCVVTYAQGPAIAGSDGSLINPLVCTLDFRTNGNLNNELQIVVHNVAEIYYKQLNQPLVIGGGSTDASVIIQGQPQMIFSGLILFREITDVPGGKVSADFQIQTGNAQLEGNFSGKVTAY